MSVVGGDIESSLQSGERSTYPAWDLLKNNFPKSILLKDRNYPGF